MAFSGIIGSGLCVFSKHPVQDLTQHVYTLNGYPYMVSLPSSLPSPHPTDNEVKEASPPAPRSTTATGSAGKLWGCWCSS